jgi:polysaccharide biosynthesis transport protein
MEQDKLFGAMSPVPLLDEIVDRAAINPLEDTQPLVDIRRCWYTIQKHKQLVATITISAVIIGFVRALSEAPTYTAETTILIEPNTQQNASELAKLVAIDDVSAMSNQYYKTQCEILRSRTLASGVIHALNLEHDPVLSPQPSSSLFMPLRRKITRPLVESDSRTPSVPEARERSEFEDTSHVPLILVERYLGMLTVAPVVDTNLVTISFRTPDPQLSANLANAHVAIYQQTQIQMNGRQSEEARHFLENKLVEIKEQLEKSEAALNDYRRRKGIIPGLISLDGKETVVLDRLRDLSKDLTAAQVVRIGLEPQVELIRKHRYAALPAVASDATVQRLNEVLNQLAGESAELSTQFRSTYPPLVRLAAKLRDTQVRLTTEIATSAERVQEQYDEALSKENKLQAEMERQRIETLNLNDAAAQYAILQRDVDTNRELYDAVLTRMKDLAFSSGSISTAVTVVNAADVPLVPTSPNKKRDMMLALMLGLATGIGISFLLESIDTTLKEPSEAENFLSLPSLGSIPDFSTASKRSIYATIRETLSDKGVGNTTAGCELVTAEDSYSSIGEAYRNLRTALLLSQSIKTPKVILIASATSREGKTVTSVNIASMFAQLGSDTLLIDGDLRRARCHQVLTADNQLGLTDVLTGTRELHQVVQQTEIDNLYFISAGSAPHNPTELLGSTKMTEILGLLRKHCEYIVIDSSPILPVSDSLLLAKLVDGIVVVVDAASTPRQQVRAACARLGYTRAKILGVVLNRMKVFSLAYPYYYNAESYSLRHETNFQQ